MLAVGAVESQTEVLLPACRLRPATVISTPVPPAFLLIFSRATDLGLIAAMIFMAMLPLSRN
jgi:hypothetical protein